ncbi:hypothetical protein DITRI_Ditri13aG0144700 [Diplodiscus trichospermus]
MAMNHATALKVGLGLLGMCLFGYLMGPPLYWHFMEGLAAQPHLQYLLTLPLTEQCFLCRTFDGRTEALESQLRANMALLEAKKIASQYQKEADKCNSGMETCEEAREKAEAALAAQKRLTAMWELRARQKGWREGVAKSHTHEQVNVQTA